MKSNRVKCLIGLSATGELQVNTGICDSSAYAYPSTEANALENCAEALLLLDKCDDADEMYSIWAEHIAPVVKQFKKARSQ
jgi:hypothetical protein